MEKRDKELICQYLRNITSKISVLFDRIEELGKRVEALGQACGNAFNQTKVVVSHLADVQEETRMDLDSITEAPDPWAGC